MRMAKPSERDIDAAGNLMGVLSALDKGYYPTRRGDDCDDSPTYFDEGDREHLRHLYDVINETLDRAPGWPGRVIGGMCYVICWHHNQILDPADDCIALHPDIRKGLQMLAQHRADFLPRLEREAREAVAEVIERAAVRHLAAMKGGAA